MGNRETGVVLFDFITNNSFSSIFFFFFFFFFLKFIFL